MPQEIVLRQFGTFLFDAFGEMPYHVGSSLRQKDGWRDVDIRILMPDEEWDRLELGDPKDPQRNARWVALTLAWSTFGRSMTGLPIDFQLQRRSDANAEFSRPEHLRSALFDIALAHKFGRVAARAAARAQEDA